MKPSLVFILLLTLTFSSITPAITPQDSITGLTNQDILTMVRAKLPSSLIIEKISSSSCAFDTFPSVLAELKYKGVPDDVLMAMVKAPRGERRTVAASRPPSSRGGSPTVREGSPSNAELTEVTIPDGTALEVESAFTVSSGEVEEGSAVSFTVVHPVKVNGATVIAAGARATARVTKAKKGGSWGRAGQLAWMMQDVIAVDGSKIPLEFTKSTKGDSKGGTVATGIVVTGLLFWPAAPFWGFKKGKDAKVPAGSRFDVAVHGNATVKAASN